MAAATAKQPHSAWTIAVGGARWRDAYQPPVYSSIVAASSLAGWRLGRCRPVGCMALAVKAAGWRAPPYLLLNARLQVAGACGASVGGEVHPCPIAVLTVGVCWPLCNQVVFWLNRDTSKLAASHSTQPYYSSSCQQVLQRAKLQPVHSLVPVRIHARLMLFR